jgi:TRAP-type mannitol/chloroaromatic compound transport system permease large subunit
MVIVILFYKRLNWEVVKKSLRGTLTITGMVFLIIAGATPSVRSWRSVDMYLE